MSKMANRTLIGVFVVGAIALIFAAVLIFGSGRFMGNRQKYVMFFESSVKGLQVGSPVMFRGVKIGEVTNIALHFDPKTLSVIIPVYVDIDLGKFKADVKLERRNEFYEGLIEKGLKARLELQSFVTGQLLINVDFFPKSPVRLVGLEKRYPEVPTIPSSLEELTKTIESLPLKEMVTRLNSVLEGVDKIVHSPDIPRSIESLNRALVRMEKLAGDLDAEVRPLAESIKGASEAARGAFAQAQDTLTLKHGVPGEIAADLRDTLKSARLTLDETQKTVESVRQVTERNANIGDEIDRTLEEIRALSYSLRSLADYLDRHPEALIRGKKPPKGE